MNFLTAKLRVKLSKVLWITGLWMLVAVLESLYIHTLAIDFTPFQANEFYDFWELLKIQVITATLAGFVLGSLLIFFLRGRFRDRSFLEAVFLNTAILTVILFVAVGIGIIVYERDTHILSYLNKNPTNQLIHFYSSPFF